MSEASSVPPEFTGWKAYLWPVHRYELKKLLPMLILFFLIFFEYNVLNRNMKDALMITAKSSGAEVIPFIKVWVMLPAAFLMTFLFTRLSNRFKFETVFYWMKGIFLVYFFLFAFFAFPMREQLHADRLANYLEGVLPLGAKGFIAMVRYWLFTSFYVMSDLWNPILQSVMFWGFANQVTRISEAKRFYGLFGIGANISGAAAGAISCVVCMSGFNPSLPFGNDVLEQSIDMQVSVVLFAGLIAMAVFRWMHVSVLTDPRYYDPTEKKQEREVKGKLSMRENFKILFRSPYLALIAAITIAYNLVINLVEVVWKHEIKALYPLAQDYNMYMAEVTLATSVVATLASLLISGNSIRKFGWSFTAMLTPAILLITSIGFFGFLFLQEVFSLETLVFIGASPLAIVVFFGSAQNVMSRAAKYSIFDSTKEMAFVPLSPSLKIKGKAAIDGIGSRLGKSGGSVIHTGLLMYFTTISASAPYVAFFLFAAILIWMGATYTLGKRFNELTGVPVKTKPEAPLALKESVS